MACQAFMITIGTGGGGLTRLVPTELRDLLGVKNVERSGQARFFFSTACDVTPAQFESLCAPEKVYAVVLRIPTVELQFPEDGAEAENALAAMVARTDSWPTSLAVWRAFTNRTNDDAQLRFRVTGNRSGRLAAHLASIGIAEAVGEALMETQGWSVDLKDYDLDVVVHINDDMLLVLLPLLERGSARQHNFSCPGLTQPVAWAMARTLDVAPGEVIVDPMCGAGIILLEAAQCWREAHYLGFDEDASQVQRCASNLRLLSAQINRSISVAQADARRLPLASQSVDAIVCDLPFGKMYGSEQNNETLYPAALEEFTRILRPGVGRAALLTNMSNSDRLGNAFLAKKDFWTVTCRRRLLLGHMESMLFIAQVKPAAVDTLPAESIRLPWEDSHGRHSWSSQKAMVRQPLQPVLAGKKGTR